MTCRRRWRRGEVFPVFQPLCRAADRVVVGAEALARWQHPDLGPVPPDEFIAIAEQTGLIGELTDVVLDSALAQAQAWRDGGLDLRVSVNLSPRSLTDGRTCATPSQQRSGDGKGSRRRRSCSRSPSRPS